MKIKDCYLKTKNTIEENRKIIYICSLIFTLAFSIFNRILGIVKESIWHETISIYYFTLVIIRGILILYIYKSKTKEKEIIIFRLIKVLLVILNTLLIFPIVLLIMNKRIVEMTLIPSIAVALYVTVKTSVTITQFVKKRKEENVLFKELRTINLMDVTLSILTLTNTLIAVNSTEFDIGMYYLSISVSIVGFAVNIFLLTRLKER